MSRSVTVNFVVKNAAIMTKTLDEMGIRHTEAGEGRIAAQIGGYKALNINVRENTLSFDDMDTSKVNAVKQNYMVNFYRDQAIREGMQLKQERNAKGDIVLTLTR